MKKRIIFKDNINNKTDVAELSLRAEDHLKAQQTFKVKIFKPKKGKGSFTRKKKYKGEETNEN